MILTDYQKALFGLPSSISNNNTGNGVNLSGTTVERMRWFNGEVPYKLIGFSRSERREILESISNMNDKLSGCIHIRP